LPFATSLATRANTDRQRRAPMIFTSFFGSDPVRGWKDDRRAA
jgi:hypothetical protein